MDKVNVVLDQTDTDDRLTAAKTPGLYKEVSNAGDEGAESLRGVREEIEAIKEEGNSAFQTGVFVW